MKELNVQTTSAVVNGNFEEVKNSLMESLEKYKGIVVTDENLKDCKDIQKDLSKLGKDIDTNRKEIKKKLEAPIKDIEGKCKELISLINEVNTPIKDGIAIFDERKREEKREYARECIKEALGEFPLEEKYKTLSILDKYTLVATSKKAIREDIFRRAEELYNIQEAEKQAYQDNLIIIRETVEQVNMSLISKLNEDIYIKKLEEGVNPTYIIREINTTATGRKQAEEMATRRAEEKAKREAEEKARREQEELAKKEEVKVPEVKEEPKENPVTPLGPIEVKDAQLFKVNIEFIITIDEATALNNFLKENNFNFTTIKREKL